MSETVDLGLLAELEMTALRALVKQAGEGNSAAAASALVALERVRKTRHAEMHQARMAELVGKPVDACRYLSSLGMSQEQCGARLGRKLTRAEVEAWESALEDRLLEVRAVEIGRMRRGDGDVPRWATKRGV
jgi:hypothetical protein